MTFKTETEKLLEKYNWLEPVAKEVTKSIEHPSDGSFEKVKEWQVVDCKINSARLRHHLEDNGFFNHEVSGTKFLLRIDQGAVEIWDDEKIRDWFDVQYIRNYPKDGILDIPKEMLENKFLNNKENLLKDSIIKRLRPKEKVKFLDHTETTAYFPYLNGIVCVTATNIKLIDYKDAPGVVYKTNILKRNYTEKIKREWEKGNWYSFLKNISTGADGKDRINEFQTVIGYLLHKYFERKLKSIILMDSRGNAKDPKGRGGKTLLGKGLGYMLNADMKTDKVYCEIDGKNLEAKKSRYQDAEINTSLIHLNDVERYGEFAFKLQSVYNDVLEGVKVKKLYKDPYHIYCKILISANHTFNTEAGSTRDRFLEVQLSGHYDEDYSPYIEFGKWFFSTDWTESDWNDFDNAMLNCVRLYLRDGLITPDNINLDSLKAIEQSNQEFINFMEMKRKNGEIHHDCRFIKANLLNEFITHYPEYEWVAGKLKRWNAWLRAYTYYHPFLVKCTNDNLDDFDKIDRLQTGTVVRIFKYYYKHEN